MRYSLTTLILWTAIGPPLLAFAWFYAPTPAEMMAWLSIAGLFALAQWSLGRSLAFYEAKRGTGEYQISPRPTGQSQVPVTDHYGVKAQDSVMSAP